MIIINKQINKHICKIVNLKENAKIQRVLEDTRPTAETSAQRGQNELIPDVRLCYCQGPVTQKSTLSVNN